MSGDDRMRSDDDLAPVTDLFGARSRRSTDGWAADDGPGRDEIPVLADRRTSRSSAADARRGTPGADDAPADDVSSTPDAPAADEWRAPVTGASRTRRPVPIRPDLSPSLDDLRDAVTTIESRGTVSTDPDPDPDSDVVDAAPAPMSTEDARADAEKISMRTLARRGVSTSELRAALRRHELEDDIVEHEVERLTRVGLLDDAQLAADLVGRLHDRKGLGRQGVTAELRRRGIDQVVIEDVLSGNDPEDDDAAEAERALDLAVKRAGQMRGLDRETAERRLSGFLMRKGYSGSVVRSAVRTALDGAGPRGGGVRFR